MAEDIDPAVIKKTQELLGSVIKKPALTEKSLKKPPFRFLHDVITNIIKTSGFLKGLYSTEELHSENVKDKDSKISFLQRAIDVLAIVTNQPVNLKPSKVVAGHDPQKTNLFLQQLATAAKSKLDSKEAVEKVLSERTQGSPVKAPKDRRTSVDKRAKDKEKAHARSLTKTLDPVKKSSSQNKESSKSKDGDKSKEKSRESKRDREKSRERRHKTDDAKKSSKDKVSKPKENGQNEEEKVEVEAENEIVNNTENIESEEQVNSEKPAEAEPPPSLVNGEAYDNEQNEIEAPDVVVTEKPVREKSHRPHSSRSARPPSARSKRTKPAEENASAGGGVREPLMATSAAIMGNGPLVPEQTFENVLIPTTRPPSARPPSARPSSSRPAPPRIRIRHVVDNEENNFRPTTAKPVENVILDESHQSEEEEEETFILMENEPSENLETELPLKSVPAETPDEDKGMLVKKLLETKKDLEGGSQHTPTKKVEIDKSQMSEVARNRERDSASKELGQLRNFVQSLSRTAIPLGRMLDFLQEDLDAMKMELRMWKEEHAQNLVALHKEQSTTESLLEPLRAQLDDLDQVVQNQLDANSALKSSITRNDERIQRMLSSVNHKS